MEKESKIRAMRYSRSAYRGRVFKTDIFLDFENMTGIKKSGNGFSKYIDFDEDEKSENKVLAFKLKNGEELQNRLKSVEEICENWNGQYVEPAVFVDKFGKVHPACDGYSWEVDLEYKDNSHKYVYGSRAEPEDFGKFVDIIYEIIDETLE